jgi:hypothetical protein
MVYEEMSFKVKVHRRTAGRQTDGRWTKSDHKSSTCHFVTGELKMYGKGTHLTLENYKKIPLYL